MAVNVSVRNASGKLEEIAVLEVGAAAGGALTGNYPNPLLPDKITAGTAAYPASITYDAKGDITSITAGSTPLTASTGVQAQATTPGTQQTSTNLNIDGKAKSGSVDTGAVTASSVAATGAVSGATVAATGAVTGASVTATGTVQGGTVTSTGAVNGATAAITGAATAASVTATGTVQGGTVTSTGAVNGASAAITNGITAGTTIAATGAVSGASVAATGAVTGASVTATGTVQGGTVTSTGAVNGATEAITGASTAASYTATGTVQGATVNATGKVQLNGLTALENGTSFPVSPSTDQRYYRTDRNLEYFYDGTRWLTVTLFNSQVEFAYVSGTVGANPHLATVTTYVASNVPVGISIMPEELNLRLFQTVVGSTTNFYTLSVLAFFGLTGGVGGEPALNTKTITASAWTTYKWTRAAGSFPVGSSPATPASDPANLQMVLSGAPGTLIMFGRFDYRRVG